MAKRLVGRILMWAGAVVGVLLVVTGILVAVFWDETRVRASNLSAVFDEPRYAEGFAGRQEMLGYLEDHPRECSLVSYTVSENGSPAGSGPEIRHLPGESSPLASTKKVVVLAAYAREVSAGDLDPQEKVRVSEWERYYLPNTDGGAHPDALKKLGLKTGENGAASDRRAEVPLSEVARAMMRSSDNAATDYLIARLGDAKIRSVIADAGLEGQEPVLPLLGTFLLWFELGGGDPDLSKQLSGERLKELRRLGEEEYAAKVKELTGAYARGEVGSRWREDGPPLGPIRYQGAVAREFETEGTAGDYARIMGEVASGTFFSSEVSRIMRGHLDWPMEREENRREFRDFGAKGGSLPGVINQAFYVAPKNGDFAGETRVVILFVRDMPTSAWLGVQRSGGFDEFMVGLATDGEFAEKVDRRLGVE